MAKSKRTTKLATREKTLADVHNDQRALARRVTVLEGWMREEVRALTARVTKAEAQVAAWASDGPDMKQLRDLAVRFQWLEEGFRVLGETLGRRRVETMTMTARIMNELSALWDIALPTTPPVKAITRDVEKPRIGRR